MFFHHSGHTHRNKRTFLLDDAQSPIQSIEFLEVGATKEYPGGYSLVRVYTGGYSLVRVYTGGYMVSNYKNRTDLARAWGRAAGTSTTPCSRTTCWARSPTETTASPGICPVCAHSDQGVVRGTMRPAAAGLRSSGPWRGRGPGAPP